MRFQLFFIVLVSVVKGETLTLSRIVERLESELNHESLLLLQSFKDDCWSDLQKNSTMPSFNFNDRQNYQLKNDFNRRILALVCVKSDEGLWKKSDLMQTLYQNLDEIRNAPTLFLLQSNTNLNEIFVKCFHHKLLNVVALKRSEDYQKKTYIYSYKAFPRFQIIQRRLSEVSTIFEPQVNNLFHYPIVAWPVDVLPRTVFYKDAQGHFQIKGYLTRLIKTFAESLNASLEFIFDTKFPTDKAIASLMNNGSVDFYLHLKDPGLKKDLTKKLFTYSKTLQIVHWNLMLPVEPDMQRDKFYIDLKYFFFGFFLNILFGLLLANAQSFESSKTFRLDCLKQFLDPALRGILSQSFVMPKGLTLRRIFIYWLLIFCGLFNCNIYTANLTTLFLNPPPSHRIVSYEDIRRANIKILVHTADYLEMNTSDNEVFMRNYKDIVVTTDAEKFQYLRSILNPTYAYPITETLWPLLNQKQMKLQRPIFRISEEIKFSPLVLFVIPLTRNSIFEEAFNRFVSRTHSSGLFEYWFQQTFNEMLEIGQLKYSHKDIEASSRNIILQDLIWIYLKFMLGLTLSLIVFVFELLYFKWSRR